MRLTKAMGREQKKARERLQVKLFLTSRRLQYDRLRKSERPDWRVKLSDGSRLAIELTEYRPSTRYRGKSTRSEIEARWYRGIRPRLDAKGRQHPQLDGILVSLSPRNRELPAKRDHCKLAGELVGLVRSLVHAVPLDPEELKVSFLSRSDVTSLRLSMPSRVFLPREDWALVAREISVLRISRFTGIKLPVWQCLGTGAARISPSADEFRRILEDKQEKSAQYRLRGSRFWLVIVCDVACDTTSHIYPTNDWDLAKLKETVAAGAFDFDASPFDAVWLFSHFSAASIGLYQRATPRTP